MPRESITKQLDSLFSTNSKRFEELVDEVNTLATQGGDKAVALESCVSMDTLNSKQIEVICASAERV